jgi:hypothetical protein
MAPAAVTDVKRLNASYPYAMSSAWADIAGINRQAKAQKPTTRSAGARLVSLHFPMQENRRTIESIINILYFYRFTN